MQREEGAQRERECKGERAFKLGGRECKGGEGV